MSEQARDVLFIDGYAALFDNPDLSFDEIRHSAFTGTLARRSDPLPLLWQHRPDLRIGWISRIATDDCGLHVIAAIDDASGKPAQAIKRHDVAGLSIGYRTVEYKSLGIGRELLELELFEISVVTSPMQPGCRFSYSISRAIQ